MRYKSKTIGEVLRMVRHSKGMTQKQVGLGIGQGDSSIQHYEKGNRDINWHTLCKVCETLGVNVALVALLTQQDDPTVQHLVPYAMSELWKEKG